MGYSRILAVAPLLLAIYGCSSSDSSTPADGGGGTLPGATSGLFVDVEVKGMGFGTASGSGVTDQYGAYDYVPGEDITFSIGGVTLGTIAGAPAITPNDFGTGDTPLNIARFIQRGRLRAIAASFVFPEPITDFDLSGVNGKVFDFVDASGAQVTVTFNTGNTYEVVENSQVVETGTYFANLVAPGVVVLINNNPTSDVTLMIVLDGSAANVNDAATVLLMNTTETSGNSFDPQFIFNEIGLGSVTVTDVL